MAVKRVLSLLLCGMCLRSSRFNSVCFVCVIIQFQFVNSFLSLFYIAFYLQDMQLLKDVSSLCFLSMSCHR